MTWADGVAQFVPPSLADVALNVRDNWRGVVPRESRLWNHAAARAALSGGSHLSAPEKFIQLAECRNDCEITRWRKDSVVAQRLSSSAMNLIGGPTVRERIEIFLERHSGRAFCDLCVGREMGLRSQGQISAAVVLISRTNPACIRFRTSCHSCGVIRKSTRIEV
jgi:hypothetical protein